MGQTVNLLSFDFGGSNPSLPTTLIRGSSSVDRALAFQAEGRGFEPRLPLSERISSEVLSFFISICLLFYPASGIRTEHSPFRQHQHKKNRLSHLSRKDDLYYHKSAKDYSAASAASSVAFSAKSVMPLETRRLYHCTNFLISLV